jgi:hypothetical protein
MLQMNDDQIERLLRQVRPAGPPARLRARIVAARRPRSWPWIAAAAALLALTVWLRGADTSLTMALAPAPSAWDTERIVLVDLLGGDAEAQAVADQIVALNRLKTARPQMGEPAALEEIR